MNHYLDQSNRTTDPSGAQPGRAPAPSPAALHQQARQNNDAQDPAAIRDAVAELLAGADDLAARADDRSGQGAADSSDGAPIGGARSELARLSQQGELLDQAHDVLVRALENAERN